MPKLFGGTMMLALVSISTWLLGLEVAAPARAQTAAQPDAEFYKGRTLTLLVSVPPGGGYDVLSRAVGRHIGRHLPGTPQIVVQNMPGAGGVVAINFLANIAAKDGTVIACLSNNTPFEPLFGNKEARYDAAKLNWIGSPGSEIGIFGVWHASPVSRWQDAREREVTAAITGVTSGHNLYTRVLAETLGLKLKAIAGYPGQNEIYLAMERGEVDGTAYMLLNSLPAARPSWIAEKKIKLLLQYGFAKHPSIPDVPFAPDLVENEEDRLFMQATFGPLVVGRPFGAPPGVPTDRVAMLRAAFAATMTDPQFLAEAKALKIDVDEPLSGIKLQEIVVDASTTPPKVAARVRALFGR